MRRLLILVIVLIVVLVGIDIGARIWAQHQIAVATEHHVDGVGSVDAHISSFPFLGRLVLSGNVSHVSITLHDVQAQPVDLSSLTAKVDGFRFDRGKLFSGHIVVTNVNRVHVEGTLTAADVSKVVGVPVEISDGQATASIGGGTIHVRARVVGRSLVLDAPVVGERSVTLPSTDLLPCTPRVTLSDGKATLACESDRLPPAVVDAIGSVDLRKHGG